MSKKLGPHPYLERYKQDLEIDQIISARNRSLSKFETGHLSEYVELVSQINTSFESKFISTSGDIIQIGTTECLANSQKYQLDEVLKKFSPWKKGPFDFFGTLIDSEWKCQMKWKEIQPFLENLEGKVVADIGCNNGYYMYKLLDLKPELVIGFEPVLKHLLSFQMMQTLHPTPSLCFEPIGLEYLDCYPKFFDTILCMGILYHHTDPIAVLKKMFRSLKTKGKVIVDCMGIAGEDSTCLVPEKRYANWSGNWFLPTATCLENWLRRSGFRNIETFYSKPLSMDEQRRTSWADIKSLEDGLDPKNPSLTIEGYPAPWRHYLIAQK